MEFLLLSLADLAATIYITLDKNNVKYEFVHPSAPAWHTCNLVQLCTALVINALLVWILNHLPAALPFLLTPQNLAAAASNFLPASSALTHIYSRQLDRRSL